MESRVHRPRLNQLFCYVLVFGVLLDLIGGSFIREAASRGTDKSSSHSNDNSESSSRGISNNGEGNSSNDIPNNHSMTNSGDIHKKTHNDINFRMILDGHHHPPTPSLPSLSSHHHQQQQYKNNHHLHNHPHPHHHNLQQSDQQHSQQLPMPLQKHQHHHHQQHHPNVHHDYHPHHHHHHHHQQLQQQQQYAYKYPGEDTSPHNFTKTKDSKIIQTSNDTNLSEMGQNSSNLMKVKGQLFGYTALNKTDEKRTNLSVGTVNDLNTTPSFYLLTNPKGPFHSQGSQHLAPPRQHRQTRSVLKKKKADIIVRNLSFNNSHNWYDILNRTSTRINDKNRGNANSNKTYFQHYVPKISENRSLLNMLQSDQAVTVRDSDSESRTDSRRYREFKPPNLFSFVKKPPSFDVSETGHTLIYECEVDTSNLTGDPEIYWTIPGRITKEKKGPQDLYPGEFRHDIYVDDNHTLIIKNVQMNHRGMYICVASVGQITEMVTMVLRVMRVSGYDLFVRLIVGFSIAFVVIIVFGTIWMVLRVMKNKKNRAEEEENGPTETTEIRRRNTDIHYFL